MPASSPFTSVTQKKALHLLGEQLRNRRKALQVTAVTAAEAAGISRMTLYRVERGDPSVTFGAYFAVVSALGLEVKFFDPVTSGLRPSREKGKKKSLPTKIRVADYAQLKRLAWQIKKSARISQQEALDLYERNWKHVDLKSMEPHEREFLEDLMAALGRERLLV